MDLSEKGELPWMGKEYGDERTKEEADQENEKIRQDNQKNKLLAEEMKKLEVWCQQNLGANEEWREGSINSTIPNKSPQGTCVNHYGCQVGNCNKPRTLVEVHMNADASDERKKYVVKEECYLKGDNFVCDNCQEGKKSNQPNSPTPQHQTQIQQLRQEIQQLESIANRTPQQEQELKNKKQRLVELEKQQEQEPNKTKYWPWILGIGGILVVGIIVYFFIKSKDKSHKN